MLYLFLFGIIISFALFGVRRTIYMTGFVMVTLFVLSILGMAFFTLLPIIFIAYILFLLFGRRYFEKRYEDQKANFEQTFKFYYYNSGDRGEYSNRSYNETVNQYDGRKYYSMLGIDENATDDEIKTAYKKMAKQYHPDLHANKSEDEKKSYESKFKEINEAYEEIKKEGYSTLQ